MTKWELRHEKLPYDGIEEGEVVPGLRKLAADGWELVTVLPYDGNWAHFYLKRPLPEADSGVDGEDVLEAMGL